MTPLDWTIVAVYLIVAVGIGIALTRKASKGTADFFVAGRSLPWWVAGTSIVATTFSTDTPLVVSRLTRTEGMAENWWWWSIATGHIATVFFFARLWRRAGILTEVEFIQARYQPGPERTVLRIFRACFDGVLVNCVVLASVTLAAVTMLDILLGLSGKPPIATFDSGFVFTQTHVLLLTLAMIALLYSVLSGLMGVAYTDLVQFGLAMVGSIWLAVVAYLEAEKTGGFVNQIEHAANERGLSLAFFPDLATFDLATFTFLIYVSISWWDRAPGRGYIVQRLLATRDEKQSMLAFMWFCLCHYVVRPWPWIIVGLVSLLYFPDLPGAEADKAYPMMIDKFLAPGIKGIMVAAMLAAFMSTVDTHLNWGASYLVNDVYQPYIAPNKASKHYVNVSRLAMSVLTIITVLGVPFLTGIKEAYSYLAVILSGTGTLMILRWYWWRVNAWSEISAIITVLIVGNGCQLLLPTHTTDDGQIVNMLGVRMLITVSSVAAVWVLVTILTSAAPSEHTKAFYRTMRIGGPGWTRLARETGTAPLGGRFITSLLGWLAGCGLIYGALLGTGELVFQRWGSATAYLGTAALCALLLVTVFRSAFSDTSNQPSEISN